MRDYVLDPYLSIEARRSMRRSLKLEAVEAELAASAAVSAPRAAALLDAIDLAIGARAVYLRAASGPHAQASTKQAVEALAAIVASSAADKAKLDVSEPAAAALSAELLRCGEYCSFSMFCVLLQRSRAQLGRLQRAPSRRRATRVERLRSRLFGHQSWLSQVLGGGAGTAAADGSPAGPAPAPPALARDLSEHFVTPPDDAAGGAHSDAAEAAYHAV